MVGTITLRHVLQHPILVVQGWGWSVIPMCILASAKACATGKPVCFLDVIAGSGRHVI